MGGGLVRGAAEVGAVGGEGVADKDDAAVVAVGGCCCVPPAGRDGVLADLGGEGDGGPGDDLGEGGDHARQEGGAVAGPDVGVERARRDGGVAAAAVAAVGEDGGLLGGALGEVLVDEPVEEELVRVEDAVVSRDHVAVVGGWGSVRPVTVESRGHIGESSFWPSSSSSLWETEGGGRVLTREYMSYYPSSQRKHC